MPGGPANARFAFPPVGERDMTALVATDSEPNRFKAVAVDLHKSRQGENKVLQRIDFFSQFARVLRAISALSWSKWQSALRRNR